MANITITERCNLRCPYCFADEFTYSDTTSDMSMENFQTCVDFIATREGERVGIIGGEPTLHPRFVDMMQYVLNHPKVKTVTLFTNGFKPEYIKMFLPSHKFSCLINVNQEEDLGKGQYSKFVKGLEDIFSDGIYDKPVRFGLNIYKPGMDFNFIVGLCKRFKRKELRISLAIPNGTYENNYDALKIFYVARPTLLELFKLLINAEIMPVMDCNYVPRCIWSEDDIALIKSFYPLEQKSGAPCNILDCSYCSPVIDILPNLTAIRCFGMSRDMKAEIGDFPTLDALRLYFKTTIDNFMYSVPGHVHCRNCKLRLRQQCMCGCLAFRSRRIKEARELCERI